MKDLVQKIKELKEQKNAIILAHYYTRPEIQDVADYLGDSLGLAREAQKTDADIIVFCGVHFMAETASVISPEKKILIPALRAGCSLAESITAKQLVEWKAENPGAVVVTYVNTTAAIKAESDYCCTSSNALKIVESIPEDKKILFLPDKNLGGYIKKMTGRNMEIWGGDCCVHEKIDTQMIIDKLAEYPDADVLIHPESNCSHDDLILAHPQTFMYSTAGIITHAKESNKKNFIIATENETIHKLKKDNPDKNFIPVNEKTLCGSMKRVTIEKLYEALLNEQYEVKVPEDLAKKALLPIQRMLEIG
jgi:quinolinate synthase